MRARVALLAAFLVLVVASALIVEHGPLLLPLLAQECPQGFVLNGGVCVAQVTANAFSGKLPRANGGLNSSSAGTGILRDGTTPAASELSGDATTSGSNAVTVVKINGTLLSGLVSGLMKNTTGTGVPTIAVAGTDYAAPTNGSSGQVLTGNGIGGFGTPFTLGATCTAGQVVTGISSSGALTCAALTAAYIPTTLTGMTLNGTTVMGGQVQLASGTQAAPGLVFASSTGYGFYFNASSWVLAASSSDVTTLATNGVDTLGYGILNKTSALAGGLALGTNGVVKSPTVESTGTVFTIGGCGTTSGLTGGGSSGSFVSNATTCTPVITFSGATGATANNGWICHAWDITTNTDTLKQTAYTQTTATLTGTTVSGDTVIFGCSAF